MARVRQIRSSVAGGARSYSLDADLRLALQQVGQGGEAAAQALAVEGGVGFGHGQDQLVALVGERRLVDDAGAADREHVGGADRRPDDAGALVELLGHDGLEALGQPVLVLGLGAADADVAEVAGERQEDAAGMVDAAERRVRDQDQALLAAVVGVRAPADVGEQAGGVAQAPLLVGLLGARRLEQGIGPGAQLDGVLGGARARRAYSAQNDSSGSLRRSVSDSRL